MSSNVSRSLSIARIDLSKDDWDAEFCDSEGLVIWCSICGESWLGGVDEVRLKDWGGMNDWVDGKWILVGDSGCWMFVCGGFECW